MFRTHDITRPPGFEDNHLIGEAENILGQAKLDFLYKAALKLNTLQTEPSTRQVAHQLTLLKSGTVSNMSEHGVRDGDDYNRYFAHFFNKSPLFKVEGASQFLLEELKAKGECVSANGYAVWFTEVNGIVHINFCKEPVHML